MKRRMYWSLCASTVAVALLTTLLTLWSVYGLLLRQAKSELADEHKLVAQTLKYEEEGALDYLGSLDIRYDSFRITLIRRDGTVLFDSDNNADGMENHLTRPEIADAFQNGTGSDVRRSETMGMDTYYYAERLDDDTVLRVSKQTRSIGAVFVSIIPLTVGIVLAVLVLCLLLSSKLTRRMLRPVEALAENLDSPGDLRGYEELEPFFGRIREQNRLIKEQMNRLREERDTIKLIISNMKEGLILIDLDRKVLSVNRSALQLLFAGEQVEDYEGRNILNVSRAPELTECVDRALAGSGEDAVVVRNGCACRIFASPVQNADGKVEGAIILLLDVTEQQKAECIRRDFTANVSHELKTPLTSISGFAEMIEGGMVDSSEDIKRFAGRIYHEASRLITLTDDIIRLSRIEEGGVVEMEPVELVALCRNAAESLKFTAKQKGVSIDVAGDTVSVQGNARMLDELFFNLMDNAVKYNRQDGRVQVTVQRLESTAVVTVSDTGIGIPKEHQERVFERFYRVDKSRSKQTGGTGLGLSIVKHIVERHRGTITLESVENTGTKVTVTLPIEQR